MIYIIAIGRDINLNKGKTFSLCELNTDSKVFSKLKGHSSKIF